MDPHYTPQGKWNCYACREDIRLNGEKVPITTPVKKVVKVKKSLMNDSP